MPFPVREKLGDANQEVKHLTSIHKPLACTDHWSHLAKRKEVLCLARNLISTQEEKRYQEITGCLCYSWVYLFHS